MMKIKSKSDILLLENTMNNQYSNDIIQISNIIYYNKNININNKIYIILIFNIINE